MQAVLVLVQSEVLQANKPLNQQDIADRISQLVTLIKQSGRAKAAKAAVEATKRLDDLLVEGGFYEALEDLMWDVSIFPYCVLKGPFVELRRKLTWQGKEPVLDRKPTPSWSRVSPFDFYWTPVPATSPAPA